MVYGSYISILFLIIFLGKPTISLRPCGSSITWEFFCLWYLLTKMASLIENLVLYHMGSIHIQIKVFLIILEIRIRIENARTAFNNLWQLLCSRYLGLSLRVWMLKCYVFSVFLYGVKSWTLNKQCLNRLEAFEIWEYRRRFLGKIECQANKYWKWWTSKHKWYTVKIHEEKHKWLQLIMQDKIQGKRSIWRSPGCV